MTNMVRLIPFIFTVALRSCSRSLTTAYDFRDENQSIEDVELQSWMSFEEEDSGMTTTTLASSQFDEIITPKFLRSAEYSPKQQKNDNEHEFSSSRELSGTMKTLQDIALDMASTNKKRDSSQLDQYCKALENSFEQEVTCACRFQVLILGLEFRCWSEERVDLHGFTGRPKYQGLLDLNLFKRNVEIKTKVCLDQTEYQGEAKETLCVSGVFCLGLGAGKTGLCGCQAKYGSITCTCAACTGGITINCGLYFLQNICVPLPFVVGS